MLLFQFFGGPGAGKSTAAAFLYYHLKRLGHSVELVGEPARHFIYDGRSLDNQVLLTGLHYDWIKRLEGKVDYAIADQPLAAGLIYGCGKDYSWALNKVIFELEHEFSTYNVFIERVAPYTQELRVQTEDEARALDSTFRRAANPNLSITGDDVGLEYMRAKVLAHIAK